jgi:serine protease
MCQYTHPTAKEVGGKGFTPAALFQEARRLFVIPMLVLSLINTTHAKTEYRVGQNDYYYYGEHVPGEIVVQFNEHASPQDIMALIEEHHIVEKSNNPNGNYTLFNIPADKSVPEVVAIFKQNSLVEYVEPNYYAEGFGTPNDKYFKYQWNFSDDAKGSINILRAWEISKGRGVVVAILDTGIAYEDYAEYRLAPDLANTAFVAGYDFVNKDEHPNDDNGHGTHIAGIIAQSTNNEIGTAGIAYQATLMPIKVLDKNNRGSYANIVDGIYYAVEHGAAVINLSLGGPAPSVMLANALREAKRMGVTIAAAAGNSCLFGNPIIYPAAYDEYVIAVGAVRYDGKRAPYSNTGGYIDLVAPGGDTRKDQNHDGLMDGILQQTISGCPSEFSYYFYQGTSMAAPHVSAVAALLIATGVTNPQQVKEVLTATAKDRGRMGWDEEYGHGIVDAYAALTYRRETLPDIAITSLQTPNVVKLGEAVNINVTLQNLSPNMLPATITLKDTSRRFTIAEENIYLEDTKVVAFVWDTDGVDAGEHLLVAEVGNTNGEVNLDNNSKSARILVEETPDSQEAASTGSKLLASTEFQYIYLYFRVIFVLILTNVNSYFFWV